MTVRDVSVAEGYGAWAAIYDAHDNPMVAMDEHASSRAPLDVRGARVLELGCGTGRHAVRVLAAGAAAYAGVDVSAAMLDVARRRTAGDARVELACGDVRAQFFAGRVFDVILVTLVLEHMAAIGEVLAHAAAVARPGARLAIHELHPQRHARGARAHVDVGDETWALPSHAHTAEEIAAALGATGWAIDAATTWYATRAAAERSPKLARVLGEPVLLAIDATRVA